MLTLLPPSSLVVEVISTNNADIELSGRDIAATNSIFHRDQAPKPFRNLPMTAQQQVVRVHFHSIFYASING